MSQRILYAQEAHWTDLEQDNQNLRKTNALLLEALQRCVRRIELLYSGMDNLAPDNPARKDVEQARAAIEAATGGKE